MTLAYRQQKHFTRIATGSLAGRIDTPLNHRQVLRNGHMTIMKPNNIEDKCPCRE